MWWQLLIVFLTASPVLPDFINECSGSGWRCLDCSTRQLCFFGSQWSTLACSNPSDGTKNPYCNPNTNKCQSTPPAQCKPKEDKFECPRRAKFPDVDNCTQYLICEKEKAAPTKEACEPFNVYNSKYAKCVYNVKNTCPTVKCSDTQIHHYEHDPELYYSCSSNKPVIKACKPGYIFNKNTKNCETQCKVEGEMIANKKDCLTYFMCDSKLEKVILTCPEGKGFSEKHKNCLVSYAKLCNENNIIEESIPKLSENLRNSVEKIQKILDENEKTFPVMFVDLGASIKLSSDFVFFIQASIEDDKIPETFIPFFVNLMPEEIKEIVQEILEILILE